jgi:hypothetical protein
MTTYINNDIETKSEEMSSFSGEVQNNTPEAHHKAISISLANVSDRLDEGHTDAETVRLMGQLKAALIAAVQGQSATPTSLLPGVPTPTSLLPGVPAPTPTSLIPGVPTPTDLSATIGFIHNKAAANKLFAWIRIYTLNALYTMPGSMLENSAAIQKYMTDGLNKLSESVMKDSQAWSDFGQAAMLQVEACLQYAIANPATNPDKTIDTGKQTGIINGLTTQFNLQNTSYQKNLELFSSLNDGINQTSTSTTQTQTLNNQNITQGPLAMITMLTQCWSVIA